MKISELFRLVWINLIQNKSKVILTSFGIVVGAATIMLVIAIGQGGKEEVAEQFKNLNAGAVDVSYTNAAEQEQTEDMRNGQWERTAPAMMEPAGGFPGGMRGFGRSEQAAVTLTEEDREELQTSVPGISDTTISFSTQSDIEGGELTESESRTIAGVKSNYADISNMTMAMGEFLTEENEENKEKVCVLGYSAAQKIFGSVYDAYDAAVYIDGRAYVVNGILEEMGTVTSGISPDEAVFIPYATGIKYVTGKNISPTITLIAEEVSEVDAIRETVKSVLADSYPNASFEISDAGTKMEAAEKSNETLTLLLIAMAVIVFIVGGIGIMNVLFVSVKERTNEIGILKAIGMSRRDILLEFLLEAGCMSFVGAILGVLVALGITPLIEQFSVRVELSAAGAMLSLVFGVITGSVFGFYPAFKASRLIPVAALNQEG